MKRKLAENLKRLEDRIESACARAERQRKEITLVAVTKSVSVDVIRTLVEMDVLDLGENRVQELTRRAAMISEWLGRKELVPGSSQTPPPKPRWHMIGHLQRNKVKTVLPWIDMIHSVDSLRLGEEISSRSQKLGRTTPILLEINAGGEATKYGVAIAAATHLAAELATLPNIEVRGLMAMAPFTSDERVIRGVFGRVRELFDEMASARVCGSKFRALSLGMSGDFEYGIEAGATHLRIGSALFEGIQLTAQAASME
jgi:hypothetical protein